MEHSKNFDKVKMYYEGGYWNIAKVRQAVVKNWITPAEYEEITGEPYEADQ